MGSIVAVCVSTKKGVAKKPVGQAVLATQHGIEGDAHAGPWHRQVSLLSWQAITALVLPGFPWVTPVRNWPGRGLDRHRRSRWLS